MTDRMFLVYDGRAILQGTDDFDVLSIAKSLREARRHARDFGYECAIYSYRVREKEQLVDELFVESVLPR